MRLQYMQGYKDFKGCWDQCARLAQSVEHETLNLRVVGSSPTLGDCLLFCRQSFCSIKNI